MKKYMLLSIGMMMCINDRATYGKQFLRYLSKKLTEEFGKGFDERSHRNMRQFYLTFPIRNSLRSELSWTHHRFLRKVKDVDARNFYLEEADKSEWSSRQLDCQINSFYYQRILVSKDKKMYLLKLIHYHRHLYGS